MPTSINNMRPEIARERIRAFREQFGIAHFYFAQHAAFPLALTSDLLYRLWANFQRDSRDEQLHIPWIAVADLLLSLLCEEVGHELYEMDIAIRTELLTALKTNPNFGQQRLVELSYFLLDSIRQQLHSDNVNIRRFAQAQRWTALAYTQPGRAARELTETLKTLDQNDRIEQIRIVSLMETLDRVVEPLATLEAFTPLLTYARGVERLARGDVEGAKSLWDTLQQTTLVEQEFGIHLSWPEKLEKYKELPPQIQDTRKDFFISYHRTDIDWVRWIVWQLEEAGYVVVMEPWGFSSEASFVEEVDRVAKSARHLVVLLSPDYLEALALQPEWIEAFWKDPRNSPDFIIAFQVRECRALLNKMLGFIIYTDLADQNEEMTHEKLFERISKVNKAIALSQDNTPRVISRLPPFPAIQKSLSFQNETLAQHKVFISYSHKDGYWWQRLRTHLKPIEHESIIDLWDDTKIATGQQWREAIRNALETARVAVLLISADFLASKFIAEYELPTLLAYAERRGVTIVPLILSPCLFSSTSLGKFQAINDPEHPLASLSRNRQEEILAKVAEPIMELSRDTLSLRISAKSSEEWKKEGDIYFINHRYKEAIGAYIEAIILDRDYIDVYNNLGHAYYFLKDYENAIDSYQKALQTYRRDTFPMQWAEIQMNLGNVYSVRKKEERQKNLGNAITHYQAVLQVYTRETAPVQWAETQIHLGDIYTTLVKRNRQANLESAIHCYQSALQIYTREEFPSQWSDLQQKLGDAFVAFSELPEVDEQASLDKAVAYYEEVSPFESYIDASEAAIENVFQEHLFSKLAQEIAAFPPKQRSALLTDLASRMLFEERATPLQQAFLNVGIQLQDYQQALPTNPQERSRDAALRSVAYKRLRNFIERPD